jgi:hypothetical protein
MNLQKFITDGLQPNIRAVLDHKNSFYSCRKFEFTGLVLLHPI